jgi:hypothetical protein
MRIPRPGPSRKSLLVAVSLVLAASPARAQDNDLAARMRAFVREIQVTPNDGLAAYLPRRGDWTRVQTIGLWRARRRVGERVGVWRFPGAETVRVIGEGGPACGSFDTSVGGVGPFEGWLGMQMRMNPQPWRRVRGNRFVPRGASADSPVFVEWRREDGAWVVSAYGEEGFSESVPPVLGRDAPRGPFSRDTAGVPEDAAFAPADWYTITVNGQRYPRYGIPRPLNEAERARLVRIGLYHGVSVFALREEADWPAHVYLLTAPGQFQPYESPHGGRYVCR